MWIFTFHPISEAKLHEPSRWMITLSTSATNAPAQSPRTLSVLPSYLDAPPALRLIPFPFGNRLSFLAEPCCGDALVLRTVAHADVDRAAIADDAHTPGGRRLRKAIQKVSRAFASDEKSICRPTSSFVRRRLKADHAPRAGRAICKRVVPLPYEARPCRAL